jgi:hypothetical protein
METGYPTITVDDIVGKYLIMIMNEALGGLSGSDSDTLILLSNGLVVSGDSL